MLRIGKWFDMLTILSLSKEGRCEKIVPRCWGESVHKLSVSKKVVIPAPYQVRGKLLKSGMTEKRHS